MTMRCTICRHDQREQIDAALVAGGQSLRAIAAAYSVGRGAVTRHRDRHLPAALARAADAREVAHGTDLVAQMTDLQRRTLGILAKAERKDQARTALAAIGEARRNLKLLATITGELAVEGAVNIILAPQWLELRIAIVGALAPFPEARRAVIAALGAPDGAG